MTKKGYIMCEDHKRKIAKALKAHYKLYKYPSELRRKRDGYINSPEARKKNSEFMKKQWKENRNKWLNMNKNNLFKKGIDKKRNKNQIFVNKHDVPETWKQKMKLARSKQITPMKDTTIEIKIQNFLKQLNIEFYTHQYMNIEHAYQCDIFIPSKNMIIECDGDYWHGNVENPNEWQLKQIEEDKIRTQELIAKGFNVIRLWGSEIKKLNIDNLNKLLSQSLYIDKNYQK